MIYELATIEELQAVYDLVQVKLLRHGAGIAGCWNIFDIHLPFDAKLGRSVIRLWLASGLCGRGRTGIT